MNDTDTPRDAAVDRLVRGYLDQETARTDATALLERVRASRVASSGLVDVAGAAPRPRRRFARVLAWTAATLAAVVVGFVGGRYLEPQSASADTLVRGAHAAHSRPVDRLYRVQFVPDTEHNPRPGPPSESLLWTRGDRFWADCAIGQGKLAIGRDDRGQLWIAPSRRRGILFTSDQVPMPEELAVLCDVNAMSLRKLLAEVLADFDLRGELPSARSDGATSLVWANLKPGAEHPLLSAALLEIDSRTNELVRLVLWTTREGRPNGTVNYTLLERGTQHDDRYRLAAHLDADAHIESQSFRRAEDTPAPAEQR